MKRGELDSRLLILVTLALVAFGLVMVYSATSASAAVGGSDPVYYLKRQIIYAALGIALMIVAQRWDYRRLRLMAPVLVVVSLVLQLRGRIRLRLRPPFGWRQVVAAILIGLVAALPGTARPLALAQTTPSTSVDVSITDE